MKSIRIKDGDLVIGPGRRLDVTTGRGKLLQDLRLWLLEPLGVGFTTPNFGSILGDMVGSIDIDDVAVDVEEEVRRILTLYQASQLERIRAAQDAGRLVNFSRREVLDRIDKVEATVIGDRVQVTAHIRTATGEEIALNASVSAIEGVEVPFVEGESDAF